MTSQSQHWFGWASPQENFSDLALLSDMKFLIKVTKSPLPTQNKSATLPRIGLALGSLLTPSKTASPLVFFPATLA